MSYAYEAEYSFQEEDEGWFVSFPAFEGAVAFGHTVDEACDNAATVLRLFIAQWLDDGRELPPRNYDMPPQALISVEVDDAYRVRTRCVTITQAAEELGVSIGRVSQLVTSGALEAIELEGRRYVTLASIAKYQAHRRPAGRPKRELVAA